MLFEKALGQKPGRTFQVTEVGDNKTCKVWVRREVELESQSPASGFGGPPLLLWRWAMYGTGRQLIAEGRRYPH